jgi:hypothetical protein
VVEGARQDVGERLVDAAYGQRRVDVLRHPSMYRSQHELVARREPCVHGAERVQFGRPIATFQAVGHRCADAYIDVEGIRLTLWLSFAKQIEFSLGGANEQALRLGARLAAS